MCMKYEEEYEACADWMFTGQVARVIHIKESAEIDGVLYTHCNESPLDIIEHCMGATIVDKERARRDILDMLDKWHKDGIMIPCKE
jgi:hypothetical protein